MLLEKLKREKISSKGYGIRKRKDDWIYSEIGYSRLRNNKAEEGIEYFFKAKELGRDDVWLNSELAWAYDEMGNYQKE